MGETSTTPAVESAVARGTIPAISMIEVVAIPMPTRKHPTNTFLPGQEFENGSNPQPNVEIKTDQVACSTAHIVGVTEEEEGEEGFA